MATPSARRALVTGAASGIGLETALALARRGDHLILADRNAAGGEAAASRIREAGGSAEFRPLDLADLSLVRAFAADELARGQPLDVLINDAGILPPLERATTRDGFELELGIAHLGHFALTGLLLPALGRAARPRVVSVGSLAHPGGRIDLDDLHFERRRYDDMAVYASAKLACLLFGFELDRRARAAGSRLLSVIAHPGVARTHLADGWEREARTWRRGRPELVSQRLFMRYLGQEAAQGAASLVFAACDPSVVGGGYYGPTGFLQARGPVGPVKRSKVATDAAVAAGLWEASERLTGVRFEGL